MVYKFSYRQVRENFENSRKKGFENAVFTDKFVYRPLSFAMTPLFLNAGVRPNTITVFRLVLGFLGSLLFLLKGLELAAFAVLFVAVVLDYVDGNVARITRSTTYYGKFLDSFSDNFIFVLQIPLIALGLGEDLRGPYLPLALTAVGVHLFTVFIEVQYERLKKEIAILDGPVSAIEGPARSGAVYLVFNFIKNLDFSFLFPSMLFFILVGALHYYIMFVLAVKTLRFVAQLAKILVRGRKEIGVLRPSSR
jgi:phosphatidylglycerophosphate synthase